MFVQLTLRRGQLQYVEIDSAGRLHELEQFASTFAAPADHGAPCHLREAQGCPCVQVATQPDRLMVTRGRSIGGLCAAMLHGQPHERLKELTSPRPLRRWRESPAPETSCPTRGRGPAGSSTIQSRRLNRSAYTKRDIAIRATLLDGRVPQQEHRFLRIGDACPQLRRIDEPTIRSVAVSERE